MDHAAHGVHAATSPWLWAMLLLVPALLYALGLRSQPRGKLWPTGRTLCWYAGIIVAGVALLGPIADKAHMDLAWHMAGHVLLGMLAPILLVLGAPVTLLLRALPVAHARAAVRALASPPLRLLTHPIPASLLNIGGMAALYTTGLYGAMHQHPPLFVAVHLHLLLAGYLFTAALIGLDPMPKRPSRLHRAVVLVLALGAHATLAKWLYAHPPAGVPLAQAEIGSQLMYYGGDAVDLLLIVIFCHQWYVAARPQAVAGPEIAGTGSTGILGAEDLSLAPQQGLRHR
jgi:putative membrane protein